MSNDYTDDDVIVISEDEARHETHDEHAAVHPAEPAAAGDLAANDQATQAVPSEAGADPDTHPVTEPVTMAGSSYGTSAQAPGYSGAATADPADSAASDTPANGAVNGSGPRPAIPMPGASATPEASAAPAAGDAVPDSSWPQILSLFVDDPHAAVRQAADVAGGALAALVAAANNREQTLRDSWQGDATGTEDLRIALRDYRDLAGRLSTLATDL